MEKKEVTYLVEGELPKKIVEVKPILENPGWVKDPKHVAFFKLENTFDRFMLPTQKKGVFMNALTNEEKAVIEKKLGQGTDLSVYKQQGKPSFWSTFWVKLDKYGKRFDLSDPMDYIAVKVLLKNESIIAPSYSKRLSKATYRYYISDGTAEAQETKRKVNTTKEAYMELGKLVTSKAKLAAFLKVHNLVTKNVALKIDSDASVEFLEQQVSLIIDDSPSKFLEYLKDEHFNTRLLIAEGLEKGAIRKSTDGFVTSDGVVLGRNLVSAVAFLTLESNQDVLIAIQARVKQNK